MNKKVSSALLAAGLAAALAMTSVSAFAQHWHGGGGPRWHGGVSIGVGIGPSYWGPGPYYGPYSPYSPYYAPAPIIVERPVYQAPPVYIEQERPAPVAAAAAPDYWYYCAASKSYYPYVQNCPAGWMRVAPNTAPGGPPR